LAWTVGLVWIGSSGKIEHDLDGGLGPLVKEDRVHQICCSLRDDELAL
jgi:hypothetical protein